MRIGSEYIIPATRCQGEIRGSRGFFFLRLFVEKRAYLFYSLL
jgi:hypothetical protein